MESVILQSPALLLGFIAALVIFIYAFIKKAKFWLTAISLLIFSITAVYALIYGAELYELGTVCCLFLIVALLAYAAGVKK